MAHFAEIGLDNIVLRVLVVNDDDIKDENGVESEAVGTVFLRNNYGGTWIQTSYNSRIRKRFAQVGGYYDSRLDAFIPPKPYSSWRLEETTCTWIPPEDHPKPNDHSQDPLNLNTWEWREDEQRWEQTNGVF
jgi:hypothetical protein